MKHATKLTRSIPLHDYGPALQGALSWLGDRYLLAEPVPRRNDDRKPFFNSPRSWFEASRSVRVSTNGGFAH